MSSSKVPLPVRCLGPYLMLVPRASVSQHDKQASRSVHPFRRVHDLNLHTQTDKSRYVCSSRPHSHAMYTMRPNNNKVTTLCRLRPRHPFHHRDSLGARSRLEQRVANTTQQRRYRAHDDAITSLATTVSTCRQRRTEPQPYEPLCANMTSSIKPEVHNVLQRRQRRTEPQPYR